MRKITYECLALIKVAKLPRNTMAHYQARKLGNKKFWHAQFQLSPKHRIVAAAGINAEDAKTACLKRMRRHWAYLQKLQGVKYPDD